MSMNPYEVLGVDKNATLDEIKAQYKLKAQKVHPDKEGGDNRLFQILGNAYALLTDPVRRARYDATGDNTHKVDPGAEIRSHLAKIFLRIIQKECKGNLIDIVRADIQSNINQGIDGRAEVEQKILMYKSSLGRVVNNSKATNTSNLYEGIINQQIAGLMNGIKAIDEGIVKGGLLLELLENYEDTNPDVAEQTVMTRVQFAPGQWATVRGHHE